MRELGQLAGSPFKWFVSCQTCHGDVRESDYVWTGQLK